MANLNRERKIDFEKLSDEQVKVIEASIETKVTAVIKEAEEKLKFLNIYGLGYKMVVGLAKLGQEEQQVEKLIGCKIYKKRKKKK